jgi:tetratricopeptide (TPR) repeat protein
VDETTSTPGTDIKPKLLDLLRQGREEQRALVAGLSAEEHAATGTPQGWAPKDVIAHVTFWKRTDVERLAAMRRGERPEAYEDFQPINEQTFERERLRTWDEVLAEGDRVDAALVAAVEALSEEELMDTSSAPWLGGRTLWSNIAGSGFQHPLDHLAHIARQRDDLTTAEQLLAQQEGMLALDSSDAARGAVLYNQGCFWSLAGRPERAIPLVRESLALRPDLVEWSKTDTDLDALRALPEFQALYAGEP